MKQFKEFQIKTDIKQFVGKKIDIEEVLNKPIEIHDFFIKDSRFKGQDRGSDHCLHLQIRFENSNRVIFTGSTNLMRELKAIPEDGLPFGATIIKNFKRYELS